MNSPPLQRGLDLLAAADYAAAAALFTQVLAVAPDNVAALIGHGECSLALGDYEDARDSFEVALAHAPASLPAHRGIGRLLRLSGEAAASAAVLQEALRLSGPDAELLFELGLSLNAANDTAGAIDAYERALAVAPQHPGALVNLGLVYLTQSVDLARAQQLFATARTLYPDSVAAQANYGLVLQEQGRFDLALAHYDALIAQQTETIEYRWNRAVAHLYLGDYARGWPDYALRHVRGGRDVRREFGLPEWDGENAAQHQLLVYAEQGIGDEIMFASCLPVLAGDAAGVVLECDTRLAALFARALPRIHVHGTARDGARDWLRRHPALDRQIAIGSLPRLLRRSAADFPAHSGYLQPDVARVAAWRHRLGSAGARTVGLSWRGGTRKTRAGLRSLELADFLSFANTPRCRFVCLQRGDCTQEIEMARSAGMEILCWPEALDDLDECAALIAALDLVISVDNTVVHLAGALGRPCWTLLTHVPDWRYGLQGEVMPWYPSLRLFRQPESRDWAPVIAAVARELAAVSRG